MRRPVIAALLLFALCMAGIKVYRRSVELFDPALDANSENLSVHMRPNQFPTDYNLQLQAMLKKVVEKKSPPDDPDVLALVSRLLEPPSHHMLKTSRHVVETLQSKEIVKILMAKRKGFYIEVGGFDGETSSNTLWLEAKRQWQGLLIEMDPYFYTMLKGHNRNAWSINCCLSPVNYTTMMDFRESYGQGGQLIDHDSPVKDNHAATKVVGHVPCFPLMSLMVALNLTHVDYFSLDVEGFEYDILQTVPWAKLDVSTFSIEYIHGRMEKEAYRQYMKDRGYDSIAEINFRDHSRDTYVDDLIFAKKGLK